MRKKEGKKERKKERKKEGERFPVLKIPAFKDSPF